MIKTNNFLMFLGGLLFGGIVVGAFFLIIGVFGLNGMHGTNAITDRWYFLAWIITFGLMIGIASGSTAGFGILNLAAFIIGLLALQVFGVFSLIDVASNFDPMSQDNPLILYSLLPISGFICFYWYLFIGQGKGTLFLIMVLPLILAALAMVGLNFLALAANVVCLIVSIAVDVVFLGLMVLLRIKFGSALDY